MITTSVKSAQIRFSTSHISGIFTEARECSAGGPEGYSCSQRGSGSEMTWGLPNEGECILTALRHFLLHSLQCLFSVLQIWKLGYKADSIYLFKHQSCILILIS